MDFLNIFKVFVHHGHYLLNMQQQMSHSTQEKVCKDMDKFVDAFGKYNIK